MEFGTYQGQSIVYAHHERELLKSNSRSLFGISQIYAFDSFAGTGGVVLEEEKGPFKNGDYSATLSEFESYLANKGVNPNSIQIYPGFFQNTLTSMIQEKNKKKIQ